MLEPCKWKSLSIVEDKEHLHTMHLPEALQNVSSQVFLYYLHRFVFEDVGTYGGLGIVFSRKRLFKSKLVIKGCLDYRMVRSNVWHLTHTEILSLLSCKIVYVWLNIRECHFPQ